MAEKLTEQQKKAVENRGGRLLVSAAAGSGKTKVLVDRLMLYLAEGKGSVNIDEFLIITYTKAAAAELRGKIAAKLNEKLAEDPSNRHLQRQLQRLYLTKISTVHAFCADILREYAYRLDIPCDFRVAEEQESQLLQLEVLDKMLDKAYEEADPDFLTFIDSQELGRDDRGIPELILQVYHAACCHVDPEKWMDGCCNDSDVKDLTDASQTVWGQYLIEDLHNYLDLQIHALKRCALLAGENGSMPKPEQLLYDTVSQLEYLRSLSLWDQIVVSSGIDFGRLSFPKSCTDLMLAEKIKSVRKACKDGLEKKLLPFADRSERVLQDLSHCSAAARGLIAMVKKFFHEYEGAKASRRIMDFSDLEHRALDLVVGKNRQGATLLAHEIGSRYQEIMVDEYQDSNAVQDMIFSALTEKRNNCFMVGDVKQSIYQFRLADPTIFLEKYNTYVTSDYAHNGEGRKIILSDNFRSAGPVIDAVNDVFTCCMSPKVGGLVYGEEEKLHEGVKHSDISEPEIEFCAIDVQEDTYREEAVFTANRILELIDGTHYIRDKESFRPITADDIVILLRSPGSVGGEFQYALEERGICVNSGTGTDLLQTEEVGFLRAMLQIIDNPLQDIPLLAVLSSRIIGFTADDLASIRASGSRKKPVYDSLKASQLEKCKEFLNLLKQLREEARLCTLSQLVDKIMLVTRMDSFFAAFENGAVRNANLQAFYQLVSQWESSNQKELGQFLDFLTSSEEKGLSISSDQKLSGAVTIMSIHKSKGLEFPVVFLCGLSRDFNREDARKQVLCNKELGIGLNCVDLDKRIRYPSVAKKAIAAKIIADSQSEEMRVLYVAMTRAKDRLIMTYAVNKLDSDIQKLANQLDICSPEFITSGAHCPGTWVLMAALRKPESGALAEFAQAYCQHLPSGKYPWKISVNTVLTDENGSIAEHEDFEKREESINIDTLKKGLRFSYAYPDATKFPSKQTATQLKGRFKDQEAAENTPAPKFFARTWKVPSFAGASKDGGVTFGNLLHGIMQHIDFSNCYDFESVKGEIIRLAEKGLIPWDAVDTVDPMWIWNFFASDIGIQLRAAQNVLREFKFSLLDDGTRYHKGLTADHILLQGVVDCAILESDGITILDFKSDKVTEDTIDQVAEQYRQQVEIYADALSRIYQTKVKSALLYFFRLNRFISVV